MAGKRKIRKTHYVGVRWKQWGAVLSTLVVALQLVQQVGQIGKTAVPAVARAAARVSSVFTNTDNALAEADANWDTVIARAQTELNALNSRPVTAGELESLRVKPAW